MKLAILALLVVSVPVTARAATLVVTRSADDGGAGTLRTAIAGASSGDAITFSGVTRITLALGRLDIAGKSIAIDGGSGVTIDANNSSAIFYVDTGASLALNDLTLVNGVGGYGSAVEHRGATTTITRCTMSGNSAFNAGAIGNFGTLHLIDSTLSGNSTIGNSGAGFVNSGNMTVRNSTIAENTVTGTDRVGGGGAQFSNTATLSITHSTIANNSATGSGGGLYIGGGTAVLRNSIVADNSAPTGSDIWGSVTSDDYNVIESTGGATIGGTTTHDNTGTDPGLGLLRHNGGPTHTMAVSNGSVAYGSGVCTDIDANTVAADQRGEPRPTTNCTRGAYEAQPFAPPAGMLVGVGAEPPGANCAAGGTRIEEGPDTNGNGVLDPSEVAATFYVCNGVVGATGPTGATGGTALANVTDEPPGANCPAGGKKVDVGVDTSADGTLQPSEVTETYYVCNGATGADGANGSTGLNALVAITDVAAGSVCPAGGQQIASGRDDNANGVLDANEITSTATLCNPEPGNASSGCSSGRSTGGWLALAVLALLVASRRARGWRSGRAA